MRTICIATLLAAALLSSCSPEEPGVPAVALDTAGEQLGQLGPSGFVGSESEVLALLDAWATGRQGVDLETGSVELATAIDLGLQDHIRGVLELHVAPLGGPQGAAVAVRRSDSAIVAIASTGYGEVPGTMDALIGQGRPTGSALKPFALAGALETGLSTASNFPAPECIQIPDNPSDETCGGPGGDLSLFDATVHSINTVYVQLVDQIGVETFGGVVDSVGISAGADFASIDSVLGVQRVNLVEMAGAYRAIAEGGHFVPATAVIEARSEGEVLWEPETVHVSVLSQEIWDEVSRTLMAVIDSGTGQAADPGFAVAGKTGTARELTDAWFVGYTDELVVAVWIGFADQPDRAMVFPATPSTITRGSLPAVIWAEIVAES